MQQHKHSVDKKPSSSCDSGKVDPTLSPTKSNTSFAENTTTQDPFLEKDNSKKRRVLNFVHSRTKQINEFKKNRLHHKQFSRVQSENPFQSPSRVVEENSFAKKSNYSPLSKSHSNIWNRRDRHVPYASD